MIKIKNFSAFMFKERHEDILNWVFESVQKNRINMNEKEKLDGNVSGY